MKSYASLRRNFLDTLSESWHIYRHKADDVSGAVAFMVAASNKMESLAGQRLGLRLEGKNLLEIGAGQQMLRLKYFSAKSHATAVDYDVVTQGLDPAAYWKVLRRNGAKRFVKTALRKMAGIDRAYWRELEKYAGPKVYEKQRIVQGDAHALPWPEASFDFVYSFSVFEHLQDPAKCLQEVARVLKPGGGFCISTHMYTSESGAHDPRTFTSHRSGLAYWAHLRPAHQKEVKPNAYCNQWRLSQWEEVFRKQCPGVSFEYMRNEGDHLDTELSRLRSQGELKEYSDQELLTVDLWALWKKP
jgi:SAM-dependent methyltransferase